MEFRVWDKQKKKWVDDAYLTQNGDLVINGKVILGLTKPTFITDDNRFVIQKSTHVFDMNNKEVFVGDYLEALVENDELIKGLTTFSDEVFDYVILCFENDKFYVLSPDVSDRIKVVGNVFEESKTKKKKK